MSVDPRIDLSRLPRLATQRGEGDTADRIRDLIQESILCGDLGEGARLNAEHLGRHLGVSHIPLREAIRALAADGWVILRPHHGAFVRSRSPQELADLFELRAHVEPYSAELAAQRRTVDQLALITAIVEQQERTADPVEFARLNAAFHSAVADASQNSLLSAQVHGLAARTRFYFSTVATARHQRSIDEHWAIVEAIRRRGHAHARDLVRTHVLQTQEDLDQVIEEPRLIPKRS